MGRPLAGHGADPRQQLVKIKGFDQIVVGAGIQAGDPVGNAVFGSEKHHRQILAVLADGLQHGQAVHARHHDVQHGGVVIGVFQIVQGFFAVKAGVHAVAFFFQCFRNQAV